jgi:hypothetical protein
LEIIAHLWPLGLLFAINLFLLIVDYQLDRLEYELRELPPRRYPLWMVGFNLLFAVAFVWSFPLYIHNMRNRYILRQKYLRGEIEEPKEFSLSDRPSFLKLINPSSGEGRQEGESEECL